MPTNRIKELSVPPQAHSLEMDFWLEELRDALNAFKVVEADEVVTPDVLELSPRYALSVGGTATFTPSVNHDDGMLAWASYINSRYTAVFAMRGTDNRWRPVADLPLDSTTMPQTLAEVSNPNGSGDVTSIVYVPHRTGGGLGHGKFWLACSATNKIRVVEPSDLSYTDYSIGTSSNNSTAYASLRYSPDLDLVFCIMGGRTRVCSIDPAAMTLDTELSGWSDVRSIDLQIDSGVTSAVWAAEYTTGSNVLYSLDPSNLAAGRTNSGATIPHTAYPIVYLPDVQAVLVGGFGGVNLHFWDVNSSTLTSRGATGNIVTNRFAYISELHSVVVTGGDMNVIDTRVVTNSVNTIPAMVARAPNSGPNTGNKHDLLWDPTYRELYMCLSDRDELWVVQ